MTELSDSEKLLNLKQANRDRQKRFYQNHRDDVLLKRKTMYSVYKESIIKPDETLKKTNEKNILVKDLSKETGTPLRQSSRLQAQQPPSPPQAQQQQPPQQQQQQPPQQAQATDKPMNLQQIEDRFREIYKDNATSNSFTGNRTQARNIYRALDNPIDKPLNLSNYKTVVNKIENLKQNNGKEYSQNALKATFQTLTFIADKKNKFNYDISDEALNAFREKFAVMKITSKNDKQQKDKTNDNSVLLYSDFKKLVFEKYNPNDKFYLYTLLYGEAPSRDDYKKLTIVKRIDETQDKTINYIVIPESKNKTGNVIVNVHKTSVGHGAIKNDLSVQTVNAVKSYMNFHEINYNDFLFGKASMSQFVGNELNKLGIKIKGQAITTLRKMKITEQHQNNANMTPTELVQHAHSLGQSPQTNLNYVSQVKKKGKSKK